MDWPPVAQKPGFDVGALDGDWSVERADGSRLELGVAKGRLTADGKALQLTVSEPVCLKWLDGKTYTPGF